ncbi:MAG: hypothetical protein P4N59_11420 [Negativicutes bacterium]|nr:hypothetical protein [Negativicutes bacterium]
MRARVEIAKPAHEVLYQDLVKLMRKNAGNITSLEMLAIASNLVGKLVAMQDQRTVTREIAMETVAKNLEAGNQHVIAQLTNSKPASRA